MNNDSSEAVTAGSRFLILALYVQCYSRSCENGQPAEVVFDFGATSAESGEYFLLYIF
jgi:hypothetical protein